MKLYKQPKSRFWYLRFMHRGKLHIKSTGLTNKRDAQDWAAAYRKNLVNGEVGIRERQPVPTLREFATTDFLPHVEASFQAKRNTQTYYEQGVKKLLASPSLADRALNEITTEHIGVFIRQRQGAKLEISSINRELQVLRRMFTLAQEWGKVEKALPKVKMLPGEKHRERVLTSEEERRYFTAALSPAMQKHVDGSLAYDIASILLDCGLRPEECFRLTWHNVRDGGIEIEYGKTDNARRRIPLTGRVAAVLEMRREKSSTSEWVFPAPTRSGHAEPSSLKKQHLRACKGAATGENDWDVQPFPLYTFRHTCLTRWAPYMDPWTLHKLAGHRDMSITKRYIHPQDATVRDAIERARAANSEMGKSGSSFETTAKASAPTQEAGSTVIN